MILINRPQLGQLHPAQAVSQHPPSLSIPRSNGLYLPLAKLSQYLFTIRKGKSDVLLKSEYSTYLSETTVR